MSDRRTFLKQSALTLGASLAGSNLLQAETTMATHNNKIEIQANDIILFQGDSITDAGRNRSNLNANDTEAMGNGYALIAGSYVLQKYADKQIKIYNRGISGNKVPQLAERWQTDCLDIKPTILSIMIGVNDYWHRKNGEYQGTAELYQAQYRRLMDQTLAALPELKLIICEPFGVKNVKHVTDKWFPEFARYQEIARDIAKEYNAVLVPYQAIFDAAEKKAPGSFWTTDGVHTSLAGANLMAEGWLKSIK